MDCLEQEFYEKISNKTDLTERELAKLASMYEVEEITGATSRWNTEAKVIVELNREYFAIDYQRANTENQEHVFDSQPYKVEKRK